MWREIKFSVLLILTISLTEASGYSQHNSTFLSPDDDPLSQIPVNFESNFPFRASRSQLQSHVKDILMPLMPYIQSAANSDKRIQRRQDRQLQLNNNNYAVQLFQYRYPYIAAAQIGPYTFSCRQATGELVIVEQLGQPGAFTTRSIPQNFEFQYHPRPGLWWFVKCVGFETGGSGLDITGVQKPGGDSGIDPNALKSLVG